jgi:hypothetical protein
MEKDPGFGGIPTAQAAGQGQVDLFLSPHNLLDERVDLFTLASYEREKNSLPFFSGKGSQSG